MSNPPPPFPSSAPLLQLASVGNDAVRYASHYVRELRTCKPTGYRVLFFSSCFGGNCCGGRVTVPRRLCCSEWRTLLSARGMISWGVHMVRHPRGSCIIPALLSLDVATPEKSKLLRSFHPMQKSRHKGRKSAYKQRLRLTV